MVGLCSADVPPCSTSHDHAAAAVCADPVAQVHITNAEAQSQKDHYYSFAQLGAKLSADNSQPAFGAEFIARRFRPRAMRVSQFLLHSALRRRGSPPYTGNRLDEALRPKTPAAAAAAAAALDSGQGTAATSAAAEAPAAAAAGEEEAVGAESESHPSSAAGWSAARLGLDRMPGRFQLFALDWLLDAEGGMHLLEANGNPSIVKYPGTGLTPGSSSPEITP